VTGGAEALRRAFDERFAAPVAERPGPGERLLLVGLGGARFALRIDEIAGLHEARAIVRLPGGTAVFVGLAGIRGRVVPVFDLAAILGAAAPGRRRWIVLAEAGERIGLAVGQIEGHAEIDRAAIHAVSSAKDAGGRGAPSPHVAAIAEVSGALVPVASVPSVVSAIADLARRAPREGGS
jgi:purine-binding chemotaxis protein CheW